MGWNTSRAFAVLVLVLFLGASNAPGVDLQTVLDQHVPEADSGSQEAPKSQPTTNNEQASQSKAEKVMKEILATLDKIIKVLDDINNAAAQSGSSYTVVSGDSLWAIAQRLLGDGSRYPELVEANKDKYPSLAKNPNLIYPGWNLTIPGVTGGTTAGNTGGTTPAPDTNAGPVSGVAQKVAQVAAGFISKYNGYQKFPYAAGTEGGNLGCANVVSQALKDAGVNAWSLNCDGVKNALLGLRAPQNWKTASAPPYQPGDVVVWKAPAGGRHKHIGIVVKNGNSFSAMNNSSSARKPILSTPVNYRAVECVIRKA